MAPGTCRQCGEPVDAEAPTCPNCGASHPAGPKADQAEAEESLQKGCLVVLLVAIAGVLLVTMCSPRGDSANGGNRPAGPAAVPGSPCASWTLA